MALHSLNIPFARVHGTIHGLDLRGGLTLTDAPTEGHTSRTHNPRRGPPSIPQQMIRAWTGASAKAYAALDAPTALAWRTLAAQMTRTNSVGYTYRLTGIALWNQVQHYRLSCGETILATPPPLAELPGPLGTISEISSVASNLHIEATCPGYLDNCRVIIRCTASSTNQARLAQRHELRSPTGYAIAFYGIVTSESINPTAANPVMHLDAGEYFGIEFTSLSPGFLPRPAWFIPKQLITAP